MRRKKKQFDKSNDEVPILNEPNVEKLDKVEEKGESEDMPQAIDENILKSKESLVVSKPQIKILPPFP